MSISSHQTTRWYCKTLYSSQQLIPHQLGNTNAKPFIQSCSDSSRFSVQDEFNRQMIRSVRASRSLMMEILPFRQHLDWHDLLQEYISWLLLLCFYQWCRWSNTCKIIDWWINIVKNCCCRSLQVGNTEFCFNTCTLNNPYWTTRQVKNLNITWCVFS